jgi:hypothetical protein
VPPYFCGRAAWNLTTLKYAQGLATSPLLETCLRPGNRDACKMYLTKIMQGVRFGTVTQQRFNEPMCLDRDSLTNAQLMLIDRRLKEKNPELPEANRLVIFSVLITKARCED